MADNETVEIEDDAEIVIDVPGDSGGDQAGDKGGATALADRQEEAADALKGEASEALAQAIRTAEEAKRAAEATAASERARREDAERRAAQREAEAQAAVERAETSEIAVITHGIEAATREVAAYGAAAQKAMEDGEFGKVIEAQTALGRATARLDRLEAQKADYESGKTRRVAPARDAGGQAESTAPSRQNVVEAYLSGYDLQAQNWLRAHPECLPPRVRTPDGAVLELGGDQKKHNMMMAGHHDALAKGYALNSEDYFRTIEEHTGHRKAAEASASTNNKGGVVPRTRPASPSAPVSRSDTPGETPRSPTRVTLNRDQQEAARISYPHKTTKEAYALYAKELIEAQKEGKIGRLTH
jgi:hypothetical protein